MITIKEVEQLLIQALEMFGTYSFDDKGADEVMDISNIVTRIDLTDFAGTTKLLEEISKLSPKGANRGENIVSNILQSIDGAEYNDLWEYMDKNSDVSEYY